jgi:cbb3-type cytochrome oxidase subunit 3
MEYLHTDWSAMTLNDWLGVMYTLLAFVAMIFAYVLVFHPKRKDVFDAQRDMVLREDEHNNLGDK